MASTGTIFFVWGAAVFFAQLSPAADTAGQIRLSVTALDSGGQPVDGLKSDDFQIADQGKPQKIIFFRAKQSATEAIPNDYSNRASMPHTKVIVFDLLNEPLSDRLNVWHSLGKSLQQLQSGGSLYFYLLTLEGTLSPIHEIGGTAGDDKTWTQTIEKTLDKAMKAANHNRPAVMDDQEMVVKKTYVALETLANKLAPFPGRRDIVWITNGMPNVWNPKTPCNGDWVDCALYVPHLAVTLSTAPRPSPRRSVSRSMSRDLHAQLASRLESEPRRLARLLDRSYERAARGHDELAHAHDARAFILDELAVDRHVARPLDLAALKHTSGAHDQLRPAPESDGALLE